MNWLEKVAATDASVLILGENGTGKEVVAREIHRLSNRNREIFVKVDLGALPETLFESELFGHRKGSFTDAKEDRDGRFIIASGGTLFLDEIGNLPLSLQSKLLSAIQNREVYPVGSSSSHSHRCSHNIGYQYAAPGNDRPATFSRRPLLSHQCHTAGDPSIKKQEGRYPGALSVLPSKIQ